MSGLHLFDSLARWVLRFLPPAAMRHFVRLRFGVVICDPATIPDHVLERGRELAEEHGW